MNLINQLNIQGKFTMTEDIDRNVSFSIRPDDTNSQENVKLLKKHSKETGISFSFLITDAVDKKVKELNLK